ncbi:fimbrillin family protein [Sphingobacterium kitahiroshimense]|uniref:fimbrillin family protein n=1 Tax=Sphingobacterium kitahiroshimense TaxID=470446 RepID=UPI00320B3FAB
MKSKTTNKQMTGMGRVSLFALIALLVVSCKKGDGKAGSGAPGPATITVTANSGGFNDGVARIKAQGKTAGLLAGDDGVLQRDTADWDQDYMIVSELSVENNKSKRPVKDSLTAGINASETDELKVGTKYRLLVYDVDGKYVDERLYTHGSESSTERLVLNGGHTYTFVAYSVNTDVEPPPVTFDGEQTLVKSTISVNGLEDVMYFTKRMVVSGSEENVLDITFKHQFSQITVALDASAATGNITAINSAFSNHMPTAKINLRAASISRSGPMTTSPVNFGSLSSKKVTSEPTIINANTDIGEYRVYAITIGSLTKTNLPPVTNLLINPGYKYNLNLKVVLKPEKDEEIEWGGYPAVRIGGDIWMKHNLGADYTKDPDALPMTEDRFGMYYQWGWNSPALNPVTKIWIKYETTFPGVGGWPWSWPSGSNPCPSNYRLPTPTEYRTLVSNTTHTRAGSWHNDVNWRGTISYGAASVFKSKNNPDVKVTFPIGGVFDRSAGYNGIGSSAFYLTAIANPYYSEYRQYYAQALNIRSTGNRDVLEYGVWYSYAAPVRCVGIQ